MERVAAANTAFALGFFKKLSEDDPRKNLFFSPMSISAALTMVFQGAKGNTAAQMSKVLSVNKTEEIHQGYQNLISEINKPGTKYVLKLANRLYGEASYDFLATFTDACEKFYHASLERCNFVKEPEGSRKHINTWVEEKTAGKIKNLLPEGIIDSLTRLVLVNAIYFKGNWANQFLQDRTVERPFKINKNESKPVQMMYKKAKFNMTYISDYQTKILELPYVENELSMIVLLPDEIQDNSTGLEKLEREITYEKLVDWTNPEMMDITNVELSLPKFKLEEKYDLKPVLSSMGMAEAFDQGKADFSGMSSGNDLVLSEVVHKSFIELEREITYEKLVDWTNPEMMDITEVELSLPKFKLEEKYDLKPVLSSMGMAEAFDQGKADFSGMSSGNDLVLSEVVHKSFIEVNEEGTEAAAATAAVMMLRCAMIVPRFTADHPFLFFIRHNKTGTILFYGRFCSP